MNKMNPNAQQQQPQAHPFAHHPQHQFTNQPSLSRRNDQARETLRKQQHQYHILQQQQQQQQQQLQIQQQLQQQLQQQQQLPRQLNGKDLIIRMLAEVFQVNQTPTGQVKWEQVSTSLVPVSLYSRTTSKWLNYLLSSSSSSSSTFLPTRNTAATTTASAMSPDSREFLMLLQQFHQQNRPSSQQAQHRVQYHDMVVFQVVAHDFLDGQCKKILNVKLAQPGTRLGQASDYFVYWKEQYSINSSTQHHHSHQAQLPTDQLFSSSCNSKNHPGRQLILNNPIQQQVHTSYSPSNNNNYPSCFGQSNTMAEPVLQTWGLNFASINDAKLFYDICSLNLVDLDFNSDYIKQLVMKDKNNHIFANTNLQKMNIAPYLMMNHRKPAQQFQSQNEYQLNLNRNNPSYEQSLEHHNCGLKAAHASEIAGQMKCQLSNSNCPSCKHNYHVRNYSQQSVDKNNKNNQSNQLPSLNDDFCPVHSTSYIQHETQNIDQIPRVNKRTRSRSTSRQPSKVSVNLEENVNLKRAKSFSTLASSHKNNKQYATDDQGQNENILFQEQHQHHPRCLSLIKNQQRELLSRQILPKENEKPQKPMRGVLRDKHPTAIFVAHQSSSPTVASIDHLASMNSSQTLPADKSLRARYTDHQQNKPNIANDFSQNINSDVQQDQKNSRDFPSHCRDVKESSSIEHEEMNQAQSSCVHHNLIHDSNRTNYNSRLELEMQKFISSPSSRRRSTGVESENIDHFDDSLARRNARLARAQYANSKNMKEFLSLDAGGVQSTPTQIAALNQRFQQQQHQHKKNQSSTKSGACTETARKNTSSSDSSQKPDNQLGFERLLSNLNKNSNNKTSNIQKRILKEGTASKDLVETNSMRANTLRSNVSTTTEDLPLDAITRQRMFKLTSEEVISEKTEPKSVSSLAIEGGQKLRHAQEVQDGDRTNRDRKERAVSLGPDVERAMRGRNVRSDTGRRRSLERSMCVDLDPTLPYNGINTTSQSNNCLPPQSNSRLFDPSGKDMPSFDAKDECCRDQHQTIGDYHRGYLMNDGEKHAHFSSALKSAPQKSYSTSSSKTEPYGRNVDPTKYCNKVSLRNVDHHEGFGLDTSCPFHPMKPDENHLMSFKSAPDVSLFCGQTNYNSTNRHINQARNITNFSNEARNDPNANRVLNDILNASSSMPPHNLASLSSYAIPLSSDERTRHYGSYSRQFHSCPNSLRRKRKNPSYHENSSTGSNMMMGIQHGVPEGACQACLRPYENLHLNENFYCQNEPSGAVYRNVLVPNQYRDSEAKCSFWQASLESDQIREDGGLRSYCNESNNKCIGCNYDTGLMNSSLNCTPVCSIKSCAHLQQYQCQKHHRLACVPNVRIEPLRGYDTREYNTASATKSDCAHSIASLQHRPYSSQSSRSPLRYGLYESEEEENQDLYDAELCPTERMSRQDLALQRLSNFDQYKTSLSMSKPVKGYDQTMSRACLKTRQRAKSQPPDEFEIEKNSEHLTQSMKNVQKLITEVQNELNSLKRRPLGFIQASDGTQTTSDFGSIKSMNTNNNKNPIHLKKEPTEQYGGGTDRESVTRITSTSTKDQVVKMSKNETEGIPFHQSEGGTLNKSQLIGTSSATKRAGQFKCVGSIRKAGFLSVKKWILKRRNSIELARKQGWKRYWVCLRGTALLFHPVIDKKELLSSDNRLIDENDEITSNNRTDLASWIQTNCPNQLQTIVNLLKSSGNQLDPIVPIFEDQTGATMTQESIIKGMSQCYIEKEPRHLIIVEDAIAQPIPEHPKRDFVFCLSTTFGDAYLFQSSCQSEFENWISAIHNACAASIARDLTRQDAIKLFQNMVRNLELEVEKKLFLRQRLESRLTSMSSMSHITDFANFRPTEGLTSMDDDNEKEGKDTTEQNNNQKKLTMRALLYRLHQQLIALDSHIEQVHCEIYQLRCYLSSCGAQHIFYQSYQNQTSEGTSGGGTTTQTILSTMDLPHPRSLLMHVSKPTKLLLIKLGVFTVSSFHAYIHANQGSADTILQKIQQQSNSNLGGQLEFRVRSRSISESLLSKTKQDHKLESDTEELIYMTNLKPIKIKLKKDLYYAVKQLNEGLSLQQTSQAVASDESYSIEDEGEFVLVSLKAHSNTSSIGLIKQVLSVIQPKTPKMSFLNYYLAYNMSKQNLSCNLNEESTGNAKDAKNSETSSYYVVKRKETLNDLQNFDHLELVEKIVFKVELNRKQMDEESSPFGISIGAQLFVTEDENLLNVYCSYIEWGSVADRANLKDEDEFLVINGVPVMDLDMMFIECIIQDENKLSLVVRSSRTEAPPDTDQLMVSPSNQSDDDLGDNDNLHDDDDDCFGGSRGKVDNFKSGILGIYSSHGPTSQIISDEYISSLVCPPPPVKHSDFLKSETTLLRQKSDLASVNQRPSHVNIPSGNEASDHPIQRSLKSKSQLNLEYISTENEHVESGTKSKGSIMEMENKLLVKGSVELASRLLKKTEQLTQLLGKNSLNTWNIGIDDKGSTPPTSNSSPLQINDQREATSKVDLNCVERLRRSILELLETEYAYIRHLETISDHYMSPLEEMSYLNISGLKQLNQIVTDLIAFQRNFFDKLIRSISATQQTSTSNTGDGEFEELNNVIQHLEQFTKPEDFEPILMSISRTFIDEFEKFKVYSSYCAAYSRLQKLLHPKGAFGSHQSSASTSIPNTLDTFLASNSFGLSTTINKSNINVQHRDFLKPLGSFIAHNLNTNSFDSTSQLKQLSEFLSHLDSSSSSAASISLPKSSDVSVTDHSNHMNETAFRRSLTNKIVLTTFQKSSHQQNFESYLIKPIQRIVKYPMLLNSITLSAQAYLDKKEDIHNLRSAVKHMESITGHVNDTQKINDEYGLIFAHIERQFLEHKVEQVGKQMNSSVAPPMVSHFGPHQPPISLSVEQLLYFNEVSWLNINEFTSKVKKGMNLTQILFVFNSCVVFICKEQVKSNCNKKKLSQATLTNPGTNLYSSISNSTNQHHTNGTLSTSSTKLAFQKALNIENSSEIIRYQSVIPVSEVQVRSVQLTTADSSKTSESTHYQWELFRCSSVNSNSNLLTKSTKRNSTSGKIYLLSSPSNELRNNFLRKIRFIIRESVRNMSLPIARSPSSKSLTPKKLSSPSAGEANTNSTCSHSTSLSPVCNSGDQCKDETKDGSVTCCRFKSQVSSNNNYKTSIEVNN